MSSATNFARRLKGELKELLRRNAIQTWFFSVYCLYFISVFFVSKRTYLTSLQLMISAVRRP